MTIQMVRLDSVIADGRAQPRVAVNLIAVDEYAEALAAGVEFPPVTAFGNEEQSWLGDGFHRHLAHRHANKREILADIRPGGLRDAIKFSLSANAKHGLRRTNDDKKRAAEIALRDPEWTNWEDRPLADMCGVSHWFIAKVRRQIFGSGFQMSSMARIRVAESGSPKPMSADKTQSIMPEVRHIIRYLTLSENRNEIAKLARMPEAEQQAVGAKIDSGEAKNVLQAHKLIVADRIEAEPEPLPTGPFRVIVVDPPWAYTNRPDDPTHRARLGYPDMTPAEIAAYRDVDGLGVADIAAEDAILWLWTTNAHMRHAFEVLDAWGFEQKTILTWVKDSFGTGDWLRGRTEHCLMAIKGSPVVRLTNQDTVIRGPLREHSRKPDEFYAMVDELCPGSKVDLFGRERREGWVVWGAEREKFSA